MKKHIAIGLSCMTVLISGSVVYKTYGTKENTSLLPERSIANQTDRFRNHIKILQSIPLATNVEQRDDDEAKTTRTIIDIFEKIQKEAAAESKKMERGTHAKGSCFNGSFQVFSDTELQSLFHQSAESIRRLRKGIFALNGTYPTKIRFANAMGTQNSDLVGDVRGFSFIVDFGGKIYDYSGDSRQDFMLNTSPMFATNNVHEFLELVKSIRTAQGDLYFINPFYISAIAKAAKFGKIYQRADTKSYATEDYWSNLPYSHGISGAGTPEDFVKFKATRCDGAAVQHESSDGKAADFLQTDIEARAQAGAVCFLLQAQFFDLNKIRTQQDGVFGSSHPKWSLSDWIENGGELWDEDVLPFQTIAKVEIKPGAGKISCDDWYVNTRLHSNPKNQPLGSVARVRTLIEETSRARRMNEIP